jgi:hypothetical protein
MYHYESLRGGIVTLQGLSVTQIGQERWHAGQPAPMAAPLPGRAGQPVRVEQGTLMEKMIPANLVDPYLAGQRWVIAGFAYRAADSARARPALSTLETPELWVLRWRSLDMQTYLSVVRIDGDPYRPSPPELFIEPGPIPVGTEMYRITRAGEEFVASHDGQSWLRPASGG